MVPDKKRRRGAPEPIGMPPSLPDGSSSSSAVAVLSAEAGRVETSAGTQQNAVEGAEPPLSTVPRPRVVGSQRAAAIASAKRGPPGPPQGRPASKTAKKAAPSNKSDKPGAGAEGEGEE
jgi:hypothetical protein